MRFLKKHMPRVSAYWSKKEQKERAGFEEQVLHVLKRHAHASTVKTAFIAVAFGSMALVTVSDAIPRLLPRAHIAYIKISGTIGSATSTGNGYKLIEAIDKALENKHALGLLLHAESPGGSPSHAEMVYSRLMEHRASGEVWWPDEHCGVAFEDHRNPSAFEGTSCEVPSDGSAGTTPVTYRKPVVAVVDSLCASACYWIVSAADEIALQNTATLGSIGVRMDMWGLQEVAQTFGVERRMITKGEHKAIGDPFAPFSDTDKALLDTTIMEPVYQLFIDAVNKGRGSKLHEHEDTFSGMVWMGDTVITHGLADRIGGSQQEKGRMRKRLSASSVTPYNAEQRSMSDMLNSSFRGAGEAFAEGFKESVTSEELRLR